MTSSNSFKFKSIRDSIYGFIDISETELKIINTTAFRRLHGIKQLSHTYLAYPTATHTRYEHSLGVMHMASRMCDKLEISDGEKELARLAALLHDIGHGPFSHTFELILQKPNPDIKGIHERIGQMIIKIDPEISEHLGSKQDTIINILKGRPETDYPMLSTIVSGSLDADKLDYFARDSYNLGVKYGVVDTERILHVLRQDKSKTRLGIHQKGINVIDSYRLAHHMIATQIYTHHVRLIADQMFRRAVFAAFDENVLDMNDYRIDSSSFLESYMELDDYSFVDKILSNPQRGVSYDILSNIKKRQLLKVCYHHPVVNIENDSKDDQMLDPIILPKMLQEIRQDLDLRDHELLFYESDLALKLFNEVDFPIIDDQGRQTDRASLSPIRAASSVISYYVFGHADKRSEIQRILEEKGIFRNS